MHMSKRRAPPTVIDKSDNHWHWDRKIPVALIITLLLAFAGQTWTAAWWASKTDQRIERLEEQNKAAAPLAATQGDRLTRMEVKVESALDGINELKSLLRSRR